MGIARIRAALAGALLLAGAATPAAAGAQETLAFGSWHTFSWFLDYGATSGPVEGSFTFESLLQTRIRVTDAGDAGDAFSIFVNGNPFALTPSVVWAPVGAYTGDEAWADPQFSQLEFLLAPGQYTITLDVREDAGYGYGEGFIRADQLGGQSVVPEPGTVLLTASGLLGVLALARRRRAS